jgi:LysM repeat protein
MKRSGGDTMRERLPKIGFLLLVAVLVVGGLTGCERQADSREPEATAEAGAEPTTASQTTPLPGATVVSATTPSTVIDEEPTPGTIVQPAATAAEGTPTDVEVQPTEGAAEPGTEPVPTEPPASGDDYIIHKVQSGETLSSIATKYNTTVQAIVEANNLPNASVITVGQELKIPTTDGSSSGSSDGSSSGTDGCRVNHTVKSGEWVYQIARNYGVSPQSILAANNLANPSLIHPGMVLCIP